MVAALLAMSVSAIAQNDPVIMRINGQPVLRSEFEYSYNKNNTEGVIDKKTVDEYVELFVNYKLKVAAAMEAKMDSSPLMMVVFPTPEGPVRNKCFFIRSPELLK